MTQDELDRVKASEEPQPESGSIGSAAPQSPKDSEMPPVPTHESDSAVSEYLDLFRTVFNTAQKPDQGNVIFQRVMACVFTLVLTIQVIWSMVMISDIIANNSTMSENALSFISLLVTAILAEVVAMAFFVVRFVFRTPLDTMIGLLKEIIKKHE